MQRKGVLQCYIFLYYKRNVFIYIENQRKVQSSKIIKEYSLSNRQWSGSTDISLQIPDPRGKGRTREAGKGRKGSNNSLSKESKEPLDLNLNGPSAVTEELSLFIQRSRKSGYAGIECVYSGRNRSRE